VKEQTFILGHWKPIISLSNLSRRVQRKKTEGIFPLFSGINNSFENFISEQNDYSIIKRKLK
jgi:hypothetical protein